MMKKQVLCAVSAAFLLQGCIARTAVSVVTLPVKAASQGVDWATTSQDEADRNRGREMRKQERQDAKERRKACKRAGYEDCD